MSIGSSWTATLSGGTQWYFQGAVYVPTVSGAAIDQYNTANLDAASALTVSVSTPGALATTSDTVFGWLTAGYGGVITQAPGFTTIATGI